MKKQLIVALGLAVLATPAMASKARLQALGEDTFGSFYINDNRNIFLNAAHVNNHKDFVTFETGSTIADGADDSAAAPRPEGGVFFGQGNLVYGVQLGNESNTSNLVWFSY
jgi:poly-gamma-glutamate capsule biosynthesis protein CapA/YwtB (metallophosphatase superfamily)